MRFRTTTGLVTLLGAFAPTAGAQQQQLRTEWSKNLTEFRGQVGRRLTLICPPNGQLSSDVYGTDTYTDDSYVCSAAVHAGVITPAAGGMVTIVIAPGQAAYTASTRNGVASKAFGRWSASYTVERSETVGRIDWRTTATGLALAGRPLAVECPANGSIQTIYGTDQYTDDSSIRSAAVHAGLITLAGGGRVVVESTPEQATFPASARNGITSREYGAWPNGFRFGGASVAAAAPAVAPPTPTPSQSPPASVPATPPSSAAMPAGATAGQSGARTNAAAVGVAAYPKATTAGSAPGAEAPTTGKLPAPTGVRAEYIGDGRVALSWDPVPGAEMYDMFVRNAGTTNWYPLTMEPITATEYISEPAKVSAGTVQFEVSGRRSKDDYNWTQTPAVTINVPRYDGRYRVTVNGFRVNRETLDSPLNADGQRDEIYVRVGVREYDAADWSRVTGTRTGKSPGRPRRRPITRFPCSCGKAISAKERTQSRSCPSSTKTMKVPGRTGRKSRRCSIWGHGSGRGDTRRYKAVPPRTRSIPRQCRTLPMPGSRLPTSSSQRQATDE